MRINSSPVSTRIAWALAATYLSSLPAGAQDFGLPVSVEPALHGPRAICTGDFDQDGWPDLAVACKESGKAVVVFNDGAGALGPIATVGERLHGLSSIASGDLDGDGDFDLVCTAADLSALFLIENLGAGSFAAPVELGRAFYEAQDVVLADLDQDGDLDIVVAATSASRILALTNGGALQFSEPTILDDDAGGVCEIVTCDLDSDGFMDVVAACEVAGEIRLIQGSQSGWSSPSVLALSSGVTSLDLKDIDGDGDLDMAIAESGGSSILQLRQLSNGSFGSDFVCDVSPGVNCVRLIDLDGDGWPECVFSQSGVPLGLGLVANTAGTLGGPVSPIGAGIGRFEFIVIDANHDGLPDIASTRFRIGQWTKNSGTGIEYPPFFRSSVDLFVGDGSLDPPSLPPFRAALSGPMGLIAGDLLGSNSTDLAVGGVERFTGPGPEVALMAGVSTQLSPAETLRFGQRDCRWALNADLDGDGVSEPIFADWLKGELNWFPNPLTTTSSPELISDDLPGVYCATAADFDLDGDIDLASASQGSSTLTLHENHGGGISFTDRVLTSAASGCRVILSSDFDNDGDADLVAAFTGGGEMAWLLNDGQGNFSAPQVLPGSVAGAFDAAAADLDADGDDDLVVAEWDAGAITSFENLGAGTWGPRETLVDGLERPRRVVLEDMNLDGAPDLVVGCVGDGNPLTVRDGRVWLFLNNGSATFASPGRLVATIPEPRGLVARDFDSDGDADLGVASYSGGVWYVENLLGDCDRNGLPDADEIAANPGLDCDGNGRLDACDIELLQLEDCNGNGVPDVCDVASGASLDCDMNGRPDECDLAWASASDCDGDGVPDSCQLLSGLGDCDGNQLLDDCEIANDPTLDINSNGVLDRCESIGMTYCNPAVPNSSGLAAEVTLLGSEFIVLNQFFVSARKMPPGSFGFFLASRTPGSVNPVPNSQGTLCVIGDVGRGVGGGIFNAGTDGAYIGYASLLSMPQPTGAIPVLAGETWHFQAWYRDAAPPVTLTAFDFEALTDEGWSVSDPNTATTGTWTRADPIGTAAQPEDDHTPAPGSLCWFTGQGTPGENPGENDVDDGSTALWSPEFDLAGATAATLKYSRWYSNSVGLADDIFVVEVSSDGGTTWSLLEAVGPHGQGTSGGWISVEIDVGAQVALTDAVRFRFIASDLNGASLVEAAIDDFSVEISTGEATSNFTDAVAVTFQ